MVRRKCRVAYLMAARKQRRIQEGVRARYTLQRHAPQDLLPHLPRFCHLPVVYYTL
jgi:hypothetical protein